MDQKAEFDLLQKEFLHGSAPHNLIGFYKGELSVLVPDNLRETLGAIILEFYIPWKGKYFRLEKQRGDNLLASSSEWLIRWKFGENLIGKKEKGAFHAFPFKTSLQRGLVDRKKVLRLDYNLHNNPPQVRRVADELIQVGKNSYLGKAHIKEGKRIRTVAFFRLKRA